MPPNFDVQPCFARSVFHPLIFDSSQPATSDVATYMNIKIVLVAGSDFDCCMKSASYHSTH